MTFILGWQDEDSAFICADSAVTHEGTLHGPTSSFGEAQQVERVAVEERAVKLLELPRGVIVGVCGDANAALNFVMSVRARLELSDAPLVTILRELGTIADLRPGFELLFGHRIDERPTLTAFYSEDQHLEAVGTERFAMLGSMPDAKRNLTARLVGTVLQHGLPPDARLAAALVALQSVGITEYLPQHGVGGAFFGARVAANGVQWQPDLAYLTYPPGMFQAAPFIEDGDTKTEIPSTNAAEKIRVLVRDGAGILLSSLGQPRARVLIPPTSKRTQAEWEVLVLAAVPPPFHLLLPSSHLGLLSTRYSKAAYIYNPNLRRGALSITERDERTLVEAVPQIIESLESSTPAGSFDLTIVTEDDDGSDVKTYRIAIPT